MESVRPSGKFVIAPCSGVGQTLGSISRQAAYMIVDELMPNETLLLCLPAFITEVEEDIRMVEENLDRIIVIEGCGRKCATKILELKGYKPAKAIIVSNVVKEMGLKVDKRKNRARLGDAENKVVFEVARRVIETMASR